jgi:hypothetical protein
VVKIFKTCLRNTKNKVNSGMVCTYDVELDTWWRVYKVLDTETRKHESLTNCRNVPTKAKWVFK